MSIIRSLLPLVILISTARGAFDFGCQHVWPSPSVNNSLFECITARVSTTNFIPYLVPTIVVGSMFLLLLVAYPIVAVGRTKCGYCGADSMRPSSISFELCSTNKAWEKVDSRLRAAYYPDGRLRCFYVFTWLLLVASIGAGVAIILAASRLEQTYRALVNSLEVDVGAYFSNLLLQAEALVQDSSGRFIPPATNSTFAGAQSLLTTLGALQQSAVALGDTYVPVTTFLAYALAFVPTAFLIPLVVTMMCGRGDPYAVALSAAYYLVGLAVLAVSALLMTTGMLLVLGCGEVELQQDYRPGISQWLLVPMCEASANFSSFGPSVRELERSQAASACTSMTRICSASTTFNPAFATDQFVCNVTNPGVQCFSSFAAADFLNAATAKIGATVCIGCTMSQCVTACPVGTVRTSALDAVNAVAGATTSARVADAVIGLLNCNTIMQRATQPLGTFCPALRFDVFLANTSLFVQGLAMIYAVVAAFKGQKWFQPRVAAWMLGRKVPTSDGVLSSSTRSAGKQRSADRAAASTRDPLKVSEPKRKLTDPRQKERPHVQKSRSNSDPSGRRR